MKVVYTDTARRHIASKIGYLVDQGARYPAKRLKSRILVFIRTVLAAHPGAGYHIAEHDIYESWIPDTPYVVIYRVDKSKRQLVVLALFHSSQDRSRFKP